MKLYTSYFARLRHFPKDLVGLSTAAFNPRWLQEGQDKNGAIWLDCPPLKPGIQCEGLCTGKCDPKHPQDCSFLKIYRKQLDQINFQEFYAHLEQLAEKIRKGENILNIDFAFLFFETPSNLCSERIIVQQWFKDNGVEVQEWVPTIMNG